MIEAFNKRVREVRLRTRFSVVLLVTLVVAIGLSSVVLWQVLRAQAEDNVTSRGNVLLQMILAVRTYTSEHVRPTLLATTDDPDAFVPPQVPAFSARETFAAFEKDPDYAGFQFKEASLNPSNPANLANGFEQELLASFATDPALTEKTGFRTDENGDRWYYIARPLTISNESCLVCHSDPASAPADMLAIYGDSGGFGFEVGDLMAAQTLYVPAQAVMDDAQSSFITLLVIFSLASVGIILLINFRLMPLVIHPVKEIAEVAVLITEGSLDAPACAEQNLGDVAKRGDELGQLGRVFQNMCKEIYAREARLRQEVLQLRVEIDNVKRKERVAEITESEYFQDLQAKVRDLRQKRSPGGSSEATETGGGE